MTSPPPPNGVAVRLDHLEEANVHRDKQCACQIRSLQETRSRLDSLEGKLWILWPILILLLANAAAIVASTHFR